MIPSPELASKIAIWKQKAIDGTLSREEMQEAVLLYRQDRRRAQAASESSRRVKAKAVVPTAKEMLDELDGI